MHMSTQINSTSQKDDTCEIQYVCYWDGFDEETCFLVW